MTKSSQQEVTHLDRFDWAVLLAVLTLLVAIGWVVVHGDQVGIHIQSFGPSGLVSSKASLRVIFDERLEQSSLESHFVIDPPVSGRLVAIGSQLTFQPREPFQTGHVYQVIIRAGLASTGGRLLTQDLQW